MLKSPIVVLISGEGTNLQALIEASQKGAPFSVVGVISNREDAGGIKRAQKAGIPVAILTSKAIPNPLEFEQNLLYLVEAYQPEIIALAGFMKRLSKTFVTRYQGRLLNIHPSLLPRYKGLHTHRAVLTANEVEHGASVHFVTDALDDGPVICQGKCKVYPTDTEETLKRRVQQVEHVIYPKAITWLATKRLEWRGENVFLDHKPLPNSGKLLLLLE